MKQIRYSRKKQCRGFALLEALIAFIVLAVGLLAIINFNSTTMRSNADAKIRAEAVNLAQAKVEELRGFVDIDDFNDPVDGMVDGNGLGNYAGADSPAAFTRTWDVDTTVSPATINVLVSWTDSEGDAQSVSVASEILGEDVPEKFRRLVVALSGSGGGAVGGWSTGNGTTGGTRREHETTTGQALIDAGIDLPDDVNPEDNVVIYKIYISGMAQIQTGNFDIGDETTPDPEVTGVLGDNPSLYPATCTWNLTEADINNGALPTDFWLTTDENGNQVPTTQEIVFEGNKDTFYYCTAYYTGFEDGWSGNVVYEAYADVAKSKTPATFCLPLLAFQQGAKGTYEHFFDGIQYDTTMTIRVASNASSCDN